MEWASLILMMGEIAELIIYNGEWSSEATVYQIYGAQRLVLVLNSYFDFYNYILQSLKLKF